MNENNLFDELDLKYDQQRLKEIKLTRNYTKGYFQTYRMYLLVLAIVFLLPVFIFYTKELKDVLNDDFYPKQYQLLIYILLSFFTILLLAILHRSETVKNDVKLYNIKRKLNGKKPLFNIFNFEIKAKSETKYFAELKWGVYILIIFIYLVIFYIVLCVYLISMFDLFEKLFNHELTFKYILFSIVSMLADDEDLNQRLVGYAIFGTIGFIGLMIYLCKKKKK